MMLLLTLLSLFIGQSEATPETQFEYPEYELAFDLSMFEDVVAGKHEVPIFGRWDARVGGSRLAIAFVVYQRPLHWSEPGHITDYLLDELRRADTEFDVDESRTLEGDYGRAPFAALVEGPLLGATTGEAGIQCILGGLLAEYGYALHIECTPAPQGAERKALEQFLTKGIQYSGSERDPEWTLDQARERWLRDTPESMHAGFLKDIKRKKSRKDAIVRTKNYIILSDGAGGKLFAKKLEENYKRVAKTFPFEEVDGSQRMPIFLFQSKDAYVDFYVHVVGTSAESARKSKGHAWRDYYATYYDSPNDPVHVHEQTHQIFGNRLRLNGGGSWFQEGVAEYIESRKNDLNVTARLVEEEKATPLRELVQLPSLLYSSVDDVRGGSQAHDNYKLAALLIEFLRESKWGKGKFDAFLYTMGKVPRGDEKKIEAAFEKVYGTGIDGVAAAWRKYCIKR